MHNFVKFILFTQIAFLLTEMGHAQESLVAQKTLYLKTHQNKYFPGDTVFFKAYLLNENGTGVPGKHLLSAYIVDAKGNSVLDVKTNLLAGIGYNQVMIPDSLDAGFYSLVGIVAGIENGDLPYISKSTFALVKTNQIASEEHPIEESPLDTKNFSELTKRAASANVRMNDDTFKRRQVVKTEIHIKDSDGLGIQGEFSIKVYNRALLHSQPILGRAQDGRKANSIILNIDEMAKHTSFSRFGKVFNSTTGEPVADNTQVLFFLQQTQWLHQTFTLNGGNVRLNLPQFSGQDELFYLAETPRGKIVPVRIDWKQEEKPVFATGIEHEVVEEPDAYGVFKKNTNLINSSYKAFNPNSMRMGDEEDDQFDLVEPDNVIRPDEYVQFETLAEMIREVVPSLYHRRHGDRNDVRLNLPDPMTATTNPVYIIDGRATTDTDFFLAIPPGEIEFIGLVKEPKKLLPLRLLGKNGIVILKTRSGKFQRVTDDTSKVVRGLNLPVDASRAGANQAVKEAPVFRATLYWKPSVVTNKDGFAEVSFVTTDDVGQMMIEVEGITNSGEKFFTQRLIAIE